MAKQNQPPTLEQLTTRLEFLQTESSYAHEAFRKAQTDLMDLNKLIDQVQTQIADLKYKNTPPLQIDWKDLLMANMGQGRYNLMHTKWHELWPHRGVTPEQYVQETGQYSLSFHLDKSKCTVTHLKEMEQLLLFIIPSLIPLEHMIHFGITEPGLSEYTSYDIKYDPNTKVWMLREGRNNRKKESFSSNDTLTFLIYLAERHAFDYSKSYEEEDK